MGNETSFQSFPAHVHNIVTLKLAESHVVHTKIYPKYKSRKRIEFARDDFSEWLRPHNNRETDVILLGHSMGGILSSEVVLSSRHRILGTINFDTPFLGMHPGVIASGLGSLFRPAPESPASKPTGPGVDDQDSSGLATSDPNHSSTSPSYFGSNASSASNTVLGEASSTAKLPTPSSSLLENSTHDPNYNPTFANDVRLPRRKGLANALHFINKHSDGLVKATQSYVQSHFEFGGAMADYNGLKQRYKKIRALERGETPEGHQTTRVRFINYYTASTGKPRRPKEPKLAPMASDQMDEGKVRLSTLERSVQCVSPGGPQTLSSSINPRISVDNADDKILPAEDAACVKNNSLEMAKHDSGDESAASDVSQAMNHVAPDPARDDQYDDCAVSQSGRATATPELDLPPSNDSSIAPPTHEVPNLPPVPSAPEEPEPFDASNYTDKDTRKLAEKDHARLVKAYKQAVKDRDKAISDRCKLLEKWEKERKKHANLDEKERLKLEQRGMEKGERERAKIEREKAKRQEKERAKAEKEAAKKEAKQTKNRETTLDTATTAPETEDEKPKRDKVFCMLPFKVNGQIDPCWVRVFMPGVDEVGAHCGLFIVDGDRYRNFVTDVAERIELWVMENRN